MSAERWREQAEFMRFVGAVHAEWGTIYDEETGLHRLELTKLTLAPLAQAPTARPAMQSPSVAELQGRASNVVGAQRPAASLKRMHETMFAASRMRPKMRGVDDAASPPVETVTDVPRAVSAKKAAVRGAKKASKRSTRNA